MMDQDAARAGISRRSVGLGIGIIALLLAALGGAFWWQMAEKNRRTAPATIEAELIKDPFAGRLFRTMKETHPKALTGFTERMSVLMRNGSSLDHIRGEAYKFLLEAGEENLPAVAQAPHARLAELRKTQRTLITALRERDVMLCARFVMTGAVFVQTVSEEIRPLLMDANVAIWRAAAAGRDHPAKRKVPAKLEEADAKIAVDAMREAGMSDADLQIFTSPTGMRWAPEWQQCAIGEFFWNAIDGMPAERADVITAMLLTNR